MVDETRLCTAMSKHTGERCRQPAVPGYSVCHYHGAGGGAPKGNLNRLVHGAYAARVLNDEERRIHGAFLAQLREDFELNASSDEVAAQMAAMAFLQRSSSTFAPRRGRTRRRPEPRRESSATACATSRRRRVPASGAASP
jgi:hypothetical protein